MIPRTETDLLKHILDPSVPGDEVVVPNGDDAAVVRFGGELVAVTTDTVVAGRHFDWAISAPRDVGRKAIEAAASDIVAMGGRPRHIYVGVTTPPHYPLEDIENLYRGIHAACRRLGAFVLGGDTTVGTQELVLTVTVVGTIVDETALSTRCGARSGDLLCVSGNLGGAAAGLLAYRHGLTGYDRIKARHRIPECRVDLVDEVAPRATAMIDVSDGLSSEVHHLCRMSGVGARVFAEAIPFDAETVSLAHELGVDPLNLALSGGDDYELLYTVAPADRDKVRGAVIGVMTAPGDILLERVGGTVPMSNLGYDHVREAASSKGNRPEKAG